MIKIARSASILLAAKLSQLCDAYLTDGATVTTSHSVVAGYDLNKIIDKELH